ncbi:MAG TPA: hypothetical protein VMU55_04885 [Solirubrobacteraceae bacterium]|nr:hypothetical protein [Solirubrobacteraceae bacterium]
MACGGRADRKATARARAIDSIVGGCSGPPAFSLLASALRAEEQNGAFLVLSAEEYAPINRTVQPTTVDMGFAQYHEPAGRLASLRSGGCG